MKKVLIIEDNDDIRENIVELLTYAGFRVLSADNGKKGVDLALEHVPDIILCDIMMTGMDGYGVLHLLHKNEITRPIPFIFITAKSERSEIRKGMELGADDYLTKPFDDNELLTAIETRLKKKEVQHRVVGQSPQALSNIFTRKNGFEELRSVIREHSGDRTKKARPSTMKVIAPRASITSWPER